MSCAHMNPQERCAACKCPRCGGSGQHLYPNTRTWRSEGIAGQMIMLDTCDLCWGSGDEEKPGEDLRKKLDTR